MHCSSKSPAILLLLFAFVPLSAQVQVSFVPIKPQFLEGEPIFLAVQMKNVGPIAFGYRHSNELKLEVQGQKPLAEPPLPTPCGSGGGVGSVSIGGISHPPLLLPHEAITYTELLKGYRLTPGQYAVRVTGKVAVGWRPHSYMSLRREPRPVPEPGFDYADPVPGADVDQTVEFEVLPATPDQLRAVYAPYIRQARGQHLTEVARASEAISEMALPEFTNLIFSFAEVHGTRFIAVKGLSRIDSPESRALLIELYGQHKEAQLRNLIVRNLASRAGPDVKSFLVEVLNSSEKDADETTRRFAALGIGSMGGDEAVEVLLRAAALPQNQKELQVRVGILQSLGMTRSAKAVPPLIDAYASPDDAGRNDVCWALATLTHHQWCTGQGTPEWLQQKWHAWWKANGDKTTIYGRETCNYSDKQAPLDIGPIP